MATCRAVETWDRDSEGAGGGSASQTPTHFLIVIKQRFYQEMEKLLTIAANLCQTQPKQSNYLLKRTQSLGYKRGKRCPEIFSLGKRPINGEKNKQGKHVRKCVVSGETKFESGLFFFFFFSLSSKTSGSSFSTLNAEREQL